MADQERIMLTFASLAAESAHKGQEQGKVRFLLLTAVAAARAGWPEIAARCRELVLQAEPKHLVQRFGSIEDALCDEDFAPFVRHLERFCSFERGEMLLSQLQPEWEQSLASLGETAGEQCLEILPKG